MPKFIEWVHAGITVATLGLVVALAFQLANLSYQLGHIEGELSVLINHVTLK